MTADDAVADELSRHDPIPPPSSPPPRLTRWTLPPYRYVPGRTPHPSRDPRGHAMRLPPAATSEAAFEFGVDLFNARYFWEAHEAWELAWRREPRDSPEHAALKGLIQVSASLLTLHLGRTAASRRLAERGAAHLERAAGDLPRLHRLELGDVVRVVRHRLLGSAAVQVAAAAFLLRLEDADRPGGRPADPSTPRPP